MVKFWLDVFARAVVDTFAVIGKDPADLRFSLFILLLIVALVCVRDGWRNGWRTMSERIGKLLTKDVAIVLGVCFVIFVYHLLKEPYVIFDDERRSTEKAINGKDGKVAAWSAYNQCDKERLTKATLAESCGSNLAYQQSRNDGQQDLFNRCMLALGVTNKREPLRVRIKTVGFPVSNKSADGKDLALLVSIAEVNKSTSPLRGNFKCQIPITPIAIRLPVASMLMNPQIVSDREVKVNYLATPWEKDTPLVLTSWVDAQLTKRGISSVCSFELD